MMGIVATLAIFTWLTVPAVRIWRDPNLRSHGHVLKGRDLFESLTMVVESATTPAKRTRWEVDIINVSHQSTFWARYRALLLGGPWPPGEECLELKLARDKFQIDVSGTKGVGRVDQVIHADVVSLSL